MFRMTVRSSAAASVSVALLAIGWGVPATADTESGRLSGWGWNAYGQLGNQSIADAKVPVSGSSGPLAGRTLTAIDAGYGHSCAIADGRAYCWGQNTHGQLGNGSYDNANSPVPVSTDGQLGGKRITAISTGESHTCALADGRAYCWGYNGSGQLGNGGFDETPVPVAVNTDGALSGKTVTRVSAGGVYTCVVAEGKAYCWGDNSYGELGNGTNSLANLPVAVRSDFGPLVGKSISAISTGQVHTCVVADAKALCWGWNWYGQLGDGTLTDSNVPVAVDTSGTLAGRTVTDITSGFGHSCAVAEGRASCWGWNGNGQLGNDTTSDTLEPEAVHTDGPLGVKQVTTVTAGKSHTCAVAEGRAYCWGYNSVGQLGNNNTADTDTPVAVDTDGRLSGMTVTAVDVGGFHSLALAATVPQAPTDVDGQASDGQVTVSWRPPTDDGGSPVYEYTATAVPGGATCTTSGATCTVTGLQNGQPFTFTVTGRNGIGVSAPSSPSAPVVPMSATITPPPSARPPGRVKGIKHTFQRGKVRVTWKKVPGATSYRVRMSLRHSTKKVAWKGTRKPVFTAKVKRGTKYTFQVAAKNSGGRGPLNTLRFTAK